MARPKTIKDGQRVSVVLSKKQLKWIQHMTIKMSNQKGRLIGVSEAIRMAIEATYPLPKDIQMDMFK